MTTIQVTMETLPLATVKARLSELVDRVEQQDERILVTRNGRPAAVLISADDLESLEETLAVMSDPELMEQIREGQAALELGDVVPWEEIAHRYLPRK
jgi:antitoxin YefM